MYEKILIPLDGSRAAESVLAFVDLLERGARVPIELLTVIDVSFMTTHLVGYEARYLDRLIAEAERANTEYLRRIAGSLKGFEVNCSVGQGRPADLILKHAAATANTLIAMATHGRSGIHRWLLGSIAEKVLRGTSSPLFLTRSEEDLAGRKISVKSVIVPLDGSALAESIVPTATEMAKRLSAEIVLLRAYELPASAYYGKEDYLPNYDELKKQGKLEAQSYLDTKAASIRAGGIATVTAIVPEGLAADEIIACARKRPDSLIALCTHGRSGLQRWVIGSVAETVVRHTAQPVLVMRAGGLQGQNNVTS